MFGIHAESTCVWVRHPASGKLARIYSRFSVAIHGDGCASRCYALVELLPSEDIRWISTYGGRFIVLPDSLLPEWRGYPEEDADPLDTSHDYGRACAISGYAATLPVGAGSGLVFGENKLGGVWLNQPLPILFEWVYANDEDAVISAMRNLPGELSIDGSVEFTAPDESLVVFDSAFSGLDFEPQHSCRFPVQPARYVIGSSYYKPDEETGLIIHRFQRATQL